MPQEQPPPAGGRPGRADTGSTYGTSAEHLTSTLHTSKTSTYPGSWLQNAAQYGLRHPPAAASTPAALPLLPTGKGPLHPWPEQHRGPVRCTRTGKVTTSRLEAHKKYDFSVHDRVLITLDILTGAQRDFACDVMGSAKLQKAAWKHQKFIGQHHDGRILLQKWDLGNAEFCPRSFSIQKNALLYFV